MPIVTWIGGHAGTPNNWNDPKNWSGGAIPVDADDVVINSATSEPALNANAASLNSLTVNAGAHLTEAAFNFIATSVINAGTITSASASGGGSGVNVFSGAGTVTNSGTITGDVMGDGVLLHGGGSITNSTSGIINGESTGVQSGGAPGTVTNAGTIEGTGSASIGVLFSDSLGVFDNTLTNSGTIIGNSTAVRFGAGNDLLKILPGASFTGLVDGGGGTNTLELTGSTSVGRLTGLGTSFTNFGTLRLDSGAQWTLAGTGSNSLGTVAITGFTALDTIDLTDLAFASVSGVFGNNALVLTNATAQETLHIQGNFSSSDFHFSSDGSGGTNILLNPPGTIILLGSHDQYVVAVDNGALHVEDTVGGRDGIKTLSTGTEIAFTDGTGLFDPMGTVEDVDRLYLALGRAPDIGGLAFWTNTVDGAHGSLTDVANRFATSPEFIHNYGSLSDIAFVEQLYQNVLNRPGDTGGTQFWQGELASGVSRGQVLAAFAESPENRTRTLSTAGDKNDAEAYRLYRTALNRTPDQGGQSFWSSTLAQGATASQVAQSFIDSAEFQQKFGALSASDFVSALYQNALHRAGDAGGQQFWTNTVQQGTSRADVLVGFSDSLESRIQTAGATHDGWVFIHA